MIKIANILSNVIKYVFHLKNGKICSLYFFKQNCCHKTNLYLILIIIQQLSKNTQMQQVPNPSYDLWHFNNNLA